MLCCCTIFTTIYQKILTHWKDCGSVYLCTLLQSCDLQKKLMQMCKQLQAYYKKK